MKCVISIPALVGLGLIVATSPMRAANTEDAPLPPAACDLAGTWVGSSPAIPGVYTRPVLCQDNVTPTDPSGNRLTAVLQPVNAGDLTFAGMFPDANHAPDATGTYVPSGPRSFRFTWIQYVANTPPPGPPFDRGEVLYFWTFSGTAEFLDANTRKLTGHLSFYSNVERPEVIVPPLGIFGLHDQDKDDDGLADEGEVPFLCLPWEFTFKRLPLMAPCAPPAE